MGFERGPRSAHAEAPVNSKHNPHTARAYLEELCSELDRGRQLRRLRLRWWQLPLWVSASVGLSAGLPACGGDVSDQLGEICDNDVDDDADGDVDCADEQCRDFPGCIAALYAAPGEICGNGVDDDGNGLVDCADFACLNDPDCQGALYAAPGEICNNGVDDDGDGDVDCMDADCAEHPDCADSALYAAPS